MRYWKFFVFVFLFPLGNLLAQDNFSESFFSFTRNYQLHLPSSACINNDLEGSLVYRTYTGKLSVIRNYYADINFNLKKKESSSSESKQVVGIGFYNDREGDFFSKARILSRYAVHIPLSENVHLSGGASFHVINYSFNASGSGSSGSAWTWSGGVGSTIYSSTFRLGASFNDLNNPALRPISYTFSIPRYLTLYGEKVLDLVTNIQLKGAGRYNFLSGSTSNYIAQLGLIFSEKVTISGFYYAKKGAGGAIDLNNIKINNGFADFSFAYMFPGKNVNPAVSQYELNLHFYIIR